MSRSIHSSGRRATFLALVVASVAGLLCAPPDAAASTKLTETYQEQATQIEPSVASVPDLVSVAAPVTAVRPQAFLTIDVPMPAMQSDYWRKRIERKRRQLC